MGEVYAAEDLTLRRHVALKVLSAEVLPDDEQRRLLEREARAVAALNHPNIVTVHSVERHGDVAFITMELVEGQPLSERIPATGLPVQRFNEWSRQLADALAAAHNWGIIHRDLKPASPP